MNASRRRCSSAFTLLLFANSCLPVSATAQQALPSTLRAAENLTQDIQNPKQIPAESLPAPLIDAEPLPIIDPNLASWNGSLVGTNRLGTELRANWVMLEPTGILRGKVNASEPADVAGIDVYVLRDGVVTSQTVTDSAGNFEISRLTPGLCTVVGYGTRAFFAFGLNAIDHRPDSSGIPRSISVLAQSAANKIRSADLVADHSPQVRFRPYGIYSIGEDDLANAASFGWKGLAEFEIKATPATPIRTRPIPIGQDGRFSGRIHQLHNLNGRPVPILDTKVQVIERGVVVAQAGCDRFGVFEFSNFVPGDFGLVAFGGDGFAAIEVQLRLGTTPAADTGADSVDLTLTQPESIGWLNRFVSERGYLEIMAEPRVSPQRMCPFCVMQSDVGFLPASARAVPHSCSCRH